MKGLSTYTSITLQEGSDQLAGLGALVASTYNWWQCFQYSSNHATTNAIIGKIGNNTLHNNEISLYIGIDHPDLPLAQLSSNGLTINSISDISNYKIHVKTWCNYFDKYTTAGLMLGSDLRDQGNSNVVSSNYSSNTNGFECLSPVNLTLIYYYSNAVGSPLQFIPFFNGMNFFLFGNLTPNNLFSISQNSAPINSCYPTSGYRPVGNQLVNSTGNSLIVYPNPFENEFQIESSLIPIQDLEIFDVLGRSVLRLDGIYDKKYSIMFNNTPGCYLMRLRLVNGKVTYHKIIKSND